MLDFFGSLFDTADFPPRWYCGRWSEPLGWLHIVSDIATFLAYAAIPAVFIYFIRRRNDLAFPRVFWLFCAFIFACGTVHLAEAAIFWYPVYRLAGILKAITAIVSWLTVIALIREVPRALELPSLATLNEELRREVELRKELEAAAVRERAETQLVLDTIPSLVIVKDCENRILRTNRMMEEHTGLSRDQIEGRDSAEIFPDMAEKYYADDLEVIRSGQPKIGFIEPVNDRWVRTDKVLVTNDKGETTGILAIATDVTAQRQAEELVRNAFDASPSGLLLVDASQKIVQVNAAVAEMFGYSVDELAEMTIGDLVPQRLRATHDQHMEGYARQPSVRPMGVGMDLSGQHRSGEEFPVEVALTPVSTSRGPHVLASVQDVSKRAQRERELAKLTKLLQKTGELADVGGWELEVQTGDLYWSEQVRRIHEVDDDFVPNVEAGISFYAPEWRPVITKAVEDGISEAHAWDQELELITAKGRRIWVRALGEPEFEDGELVRLVGAFQDISSRKAAEQQLEATAQELQVASHRLDLALRNANIGLWDWVASSTDVYYSPTYKLQLGYRADTDWTSFEDWEALLHPDDQDHALSDLQSYFDHETETFLTQFRMRAADGSYRWIESRGRAVFDGNGKPAHMTGVHLDVTDQVEAEQRLKQLNGQLTLSNDELQKFAYVASHDLRSPLRGITNLSEWIQEDLASASITLPGQTEEHLREIGRQSKRMENLLDGLLQYARVGHRRERVEEIETRALVEQTAALACAASDFVVRLEGDFPKIATEKSPLERILLNLLTNAVKHHDAPPGRIVVRCTKEEELLRFTVSDDGPGIDERHYERVFEIFRTVKAIEGQQASGLGLSIVKRTVELYGGRVGIEPNTPKGTTFWFTWPLSIDS